MMFNFFDNSDLVLRTVRSDGGYDKFRYVFKDSINKKIDMISPEVAFDFNNDTKKFSLWINFPNDDIRSYIRHKQGKFSNKIDNMAVLVEPIEKFDVEHFTEEIKDFHGAWLKILPELKEIADHSWWGQFMH